MSQPFLKRELGTFDSAMLLVGITIGSGIFGTPADIAGHATSFMSVLLFWLLGAVVLFLGAMVYAELGTRLPNTGGDYIFLSRIWGPHVGFMFGWATFFMIRTSASAGIALIAVDYFRQLIGIATFTTGERLFGAALVIVLFAVLNYRGIRAGAWYQNISTVVKVGGLLSLVAAGFVMLFVTNQPMMLNTVVPLAGSVHGAFGNGVLAMMLVLFSYFGWDRMSYVAGEMKSPRRSIPPAMLAGVLVVVTTYLSMNFLYHAVLGIDGVRSHSAVAYATAQVLFGYPGALMVVLLVIVSTTGSLNGTYMTAPRVYHMMARDGFFPRWLHRVHPVYRTPSRSIIAHAFWSIVILVVRVNFADIVSGMAFTVLLFLALSTAAVMRARRHGIGDSQCWTMPAYPVLPLLLLLIITILLVARVIYAPSEALFDLLIVGAGLPFALYVCRGKSREDMDLPQEAPVKVLNNE